MFFKLQENVYSVGFFIEMLSVTLSAALTFLYSRFCAYSSSSPALTDSSEQTLPICLGKLFILKFYMYISKDINHFQKCHTLNFVGSPSLKEIWIVVSLHLRKESPNFCLNTRLRKITEISLT